MKLKWHQAPVKTIWGDEMVVASIDIDKDHTVDLYCERSQTAKVESMLLQAEQEPVAWGVFDGPNLHDVNFTEEDAQEPVLIGWDTKTDKPIYTTVSPRKPLTYVEIERLYYKCAKYQEEPMEVSGWQEFARAIESAHGITGESK